MNKKAFTLIELLAVIAILAIIMVIAVPTVLNTISTAKKGAFKDNALSVIKAVENKIMTNALEMNENINILNGTYMMIDIKDVDIDNKNSVSGYVYVVNINNEIKYYISMYNNEYIICQTEKNSINTSNIADNKTNTCNDIENYVFNSVKDVNNKLVTATNTDTNQIIYNGTINNLKLINKIVVNDSNYFILFKDGTLYGFGINGSGQLGLGDKNSRSEPVKIDVPGNVIDVSSYISNTIALTSDGNVYTWGTNTYGQLGDGTTVEKLIPTRVNYFSDNNIIIKEIYNGENTNYALDINNTLYTFGNAGSGRLGNGTLNNSSLPIKLITPNSLKILKVWGFPGHGFLLLEDGDYYVFGANSDGRLGNGTTSYILSPTKLSINAFNKDDIKDIYTNGGTTIFLLNNGEIYSTGLNDNGQLGIGNYTNSLVPIKVNLTDKVETVYLGRRSTIVKLANGDYYGFGLNAGSQLGDGTKTNKSTPTKLAFTQRNIDDIECNFSYCLMLLNDNTIYKPGPLNKYDTKLDFQSLYFGN